MQTLPYVLACILVPAIWGLTVSFFFEIRDRRRATDTSKDTAETKDMYYI